MSDFHHAVNEGTLVMEPWTIILIRSFTKAITVFLDYIIVPSHQTWDFLWHNSHNVGRQLQDAENCLQGLWLLGKKSDMARNIAEILSFTLSQIRLDFEL